MGGPRCRDRTKIRANGGVRWEDAGMDRRSLVAAAGAVAGFAWLIAGGLPAAAQTADTIRLIYPFAAGGSGDGMARLIADRISGGLSKAAIVENRTGAAGRIGVKAVTSAEPDGTTLLFAPMPVVSIYPHSYARLDYDPVRDLEPIALAATFEVALAVGPQMPAKSLAELVAWAKADPSKASYGSPGAGGLGHFFAVMFSASAGIEPRHVSYRGSAATLNDLVADQIPFVVVPLSDCAELHRAGRIRVLATSGAERSPLLGDVPTFREAGVPVQGIGWYGLYAPAKTPMSIIGNLNKVVTDALAEPAFKERVLKLGLVPRSSTPAELAAIQREDAERWAPAVKASGFTPQQ
jgi:tripartite-type tricarboxylate transporter receptor subunit TctC